MTRFTAILLVFVIANRYLFVCSLIDYGVRKATESDLFLI